MSAATVVEAVDVVKERSGHLGACVPSVPPDQFGFEGFEESFDGRVVVAIAFAAH